MSYPSYRDRPIVKTQDVSNSIINLDDSFKKRLSNVKYGSCPSVNQRLGGSRNPVFDGYLFSDKCKIPSFYSDYFNQYNTRSGRLNDQYYYVIRQDLSHLRNTYDEPNLAYQTYVFSKDEIPFKDSSLWGRGRTPAMSLTDAIDKKGLRLSKYDDGTFQEFYDCDEEPTFMFKPWTKKEYDNFHKKYKGGKK